MRFFIELSYNGSNFYGWQIQKNVKTIEGELEFCLSKLLKIPINIIGASRTDRGVHAKQMFAHFDIDKNFNIENIVNRLNIFLPKSIRIFRIFPVKDNYHSRFNAIKRTYKYFISNKKNPFYSDFYWYCYYTLDYKKMYLASKLLMNYKNFSVFCKKKSIYKTKNYICKIYNSILYKEKEFLCFTIQANRFLRCMVRFIIGALVDIGRKKITINDFINIIELKKINYCLPIAPASGLFLYKIFYPIDVYKIIYET